MAFDASITLRSLSFSPAVDGEDSTALPARAIVSVNGMLVHRSTGAILLPTPQVFASSPFSLPITNQADGAGGAIWGDGNGNTFSTASGYHSHSYRIDIEYKQGNNWIKGRSFPELVVPSSGDTLDLDLAYEIGRTVYDNE